MDEASVIVARGTMETTKKCGHTNADPKDAKVTTMDSGTVSTGRGMGLGENRA